jgi:SAM-dependent methyltransferase
MEDEMMDLMDSARAWTAVAAAWDANVDEIDDHSAEATHAVIDRLAVQPGDKLLELAAGPGSLGSTWSRLVGPTGRVLLSDVAPGMVDVARRRNSTLDNVDTAIVDATAIDHADASFDVVVCRMGLMFAPDPAVAFAEIFRVLRPGGRVGVLTWGAIEHNPWMTCVGMAAMMNGLVSGGPPTGPGGIFSLSDPVRLEQLARGAAFVDVRVDTVPVTFRAPTIEAHVERVSSLAGPLAVVLAHASPEQVHAFHRTAHDLAAPHLTGDGVAIPGQALILTAGR